MRIVIAVAGDVGFHLAKLMADESQDIVLIDTDEDVLEYVQNHLDVLTIKGDSTCIETLKNAQVQDAQLLIAATSFENTNIITAILGKKLGVAKSIARVNKSDYLETEVIDHFNSIGVDSIISTEFLASREIIRLLDEAVLTDIYQFEGGKLSLAGITLDKNSVVVGKKIAETSHHNPHMLFRPIAIKRENKTLIPRGDTELKLGDHVYFITKNGGIGTITELSGKEKVRVDNVMILGGSSIAVLTAKKLEKRLNVKLIEADKEKCLQLAEELNNTLIIHGDGTDIDLLEDEGLEQMDAFIALTGNSETNIISSLMAKKHNVRKTIALVEKVELTSLSQDIGVDTLINRKLIAANNIFRYLRKGKVKDVTGLHGVNAEVIEYEVNHNSKVLESPINQLKFPKGAIIGGIIRNEVSYIPESNFEIRAGDKVVVFTLPKVIQEVEKFFN